MFIAFGEQFWRDNTLARTKMPYPRHYTIPLCFVADDAFALKPILMKPCPQIGLAIDQYVVKYRLSSARRISDNIFGILAS